ncbi:MAG: phenylacetate-CoA oxygenase subunit PaaC [Gammaproteobacteria bacterium]|nr:phenylacetate-CoA oxygenase subunit PaaC [Gammaproteobacteria bacterium]MDH4253443.1 phenylacetate-CoA oxygenase subunit PaaC [Gammaproteobacteria bacterium]MDH5309195.1 phenylacetate-CoA oxygenase subunit PaaC [Gammaproteobacteria bacterium]
MASKTSESGGDDAAVLLACVRRLGDNALVLGQRLTELVAHGPELEEELANANFALDYIGQARMFYSYAGELEGQGRSEDDFAFLRDAHEFQNFLLLEQPNGHFGDTVVRQLLFQAFYVLQLAAFAQCSDERLASIATRVVKEVRYHLRHSTQWFVRLGDGTDLSHARVAESVERLWPYTSELFDGDAIDDAMRVSWGGPDLDALRGEWRRSLEFVFADAGLRVPVDGWKPGGGRRGVHTEHMGYLLAELQFMQRAYPGAAW